MKEIVRKFIIVIGSYFLGISLVLATYTGIAVSHGLEYTFSFINGICPVLKIKDAGYVLLPKPHVNGDYETPAGNYGPVVVVDEESWQNEGFLEHELTHVRQRYQYFFLGFHLLYRYSDSHRIFFEYEAYKAENTNISDEEIALDLSMDIYGNNLTREQILQIISSYGTQPRLVRNAG